MMHGSSIAWSIDPIIYTLEYLVPKTCKKRVKGSSVVIAGAYDFQRLTFLTTCLRGFILRRIWSKSTPPAPQTRQTFGSLTWKFNSFSSQNSWEVLSENKRKLGRHWTYLIVSPISNRNSKNSKLSCIRFSGNIEWNNIPLKITFKEMHCIELPVLSLEEKSAYAKIFHLFHFSLYYVLELRDMYFSSDPNHN